jgi:Ca2+-binding EF-hand superfamily protein
LHFKDIPKKDYFTEGTRESFFNVFKGHFEIDEQIEMFKKRLTRKPTFDIHDAFSTIDYYKNGKLTIDDLKRMLQRNGFTPTDTELALLNKRFDRNLNGYISY